jgi:hypothetical protein
MAIAAAQSACRPWMVRAGVSLASADDVIDGMKNLRARDQWSLALLIAANGSFTTSITMRGRRETRAVTFENATLLDARHLRPVAHLRRYGSM